MTMKRPPTNITKHEIQSLYQLKTDNDLIQGPRSWGGWGGQAPPLFTADAVSNDDGSPHSKLRSAVPVIVKPADKGGAIVIWPKDSYLKEAYRQLNDSNHNRKIPHDPTPEILTETKKLAYNLYKSKIIDNTTYKFLIQESLLVKIF